MPRSGAVDLAKRSPALAGQSVVGAECGGKVKIDSFSSHKNYKKQVIVKKTSITPAVTLTTPYNAEGKRFINSQPQRETLREKKWKKNNALVLSAPNTHTHEPAGTLESISFWKTTHTIF